MPTSPVTRDTRLRKPVSVTYRTGLGHAETEIGKWRAETGSTKSPVLPSNSRICRLETPARQPKSSRMGLAKLAAPHKLPAFLSSVPFGGEFAREDRSGHRRCLQQAV